SACGGAGAGGGGGFGAAWSGGEAGRGARGWLMSCVLIAHASEGRDDAPDACADLILLHGGWATILSGAADSKRSPRPLEPSPQQQPLTRRKQCNHRRQVREAL